MNTFGGEESVSAAFFRIGRMRRVLEESDLIFDNNIRGKEDENSDGTAQPDGWRF